MTTGIEKSKGMDELFKQLDSLPEKVEISLTRKGLKEIGNDLVAEAKSLAPVRQGDIITRRGKTHNTRNRRGTFGTSSQRFQGAFSSIGFYKAGGLRDSIGSLVKKSGKKAGVILTVGSSMFYARFVEFGFMHYANKGKRTHVAARPFLTPVLESAYSKAMDRLRTFLASEVGKELAKNAKKWVNGA